MSLLTGLVSSGPAGAAWAAKAGNAIAAIMSRSRNLQRVLRFAVTTLSPQADALNEARRHGH